MTSEAFNIVSVTVMRRRGILSLGVQTFFFYENHVFEWLYKQVMIVYPEEA